MRRDLQIAGVTLLSGAMIAYGFAEDRSPIKFDPPVHTLTATSTEVAITIQTTR